VSIDEVRQYALDNGEQMWPAPGEAYLGIVSLKGPARFKGTVVVFHGNGGAAVFRTFYISALESRGLRVVLAEYPGYGGRPGKLSQDCLVADGRRTARLALKEFGGPLYLWGESLGCGVASALAADPELRARGVVMITPWDSLPNEGKAKVPWLPVGSLLHERYDNVANLASYKGPKAVIMAGQDEVIPNRLTERLYDSLCAPKRLWVFEAAGHKDWPREASLVWWDEVIDFLDSGQ
jgi:pimeloyl-ACP methyl ester carboxylesterase